MKSYLVNTTYKIIVDDTITTLNLTLFNPSTKTITFEKGTGITDFYFSLGSGDKLIESIIIPDNFITSM